MGLCSSNCGYCSGMLKANIDISNLSKENPFGLSDYSKELRTIVFLQVRLKLFFKRIAREKARASSLLFKIKKPSARESIREQGKVLIEDNSTYVGQLRNGVREGYGRLKWDSFEYHGQFYDNKPNGLGKLTDNKSNVFFGLFRNFYIEGYGRYKSHLGVSSEGEWSNHKQDGFGIEKWNKTSVYRGEYKNGLKHGIGIICFKGVDGYEGEFLNGEMSGRGTFYFSDKRRYQGQWKNNKMNGFGIITWPDGKIFEGKFVDDVKEGFGILYALSKVYIGYWSKNSPIGKVVIINNGRIQKQLWVNGKPARSLDDNIATPFDKFAIPDLIKYSMIVSNRTTKSTNANLAESNENIH